MPINTYSSLYADIEIDSRKLEECAEYYGITTVENIIQNTRGLVNVTLEYGNFFITIFGKKQAAELEAIAEMLNGIEVPITKPLRGDNGYVFQFGDLPCLATRRIKGSHYVDVKHEKKHPLPKNAHREIARVFWNLHKQLPRAMASASKRGMAIDRDGCRDVLQRKGIKEAWQKLKEHTDGCQQYDQYYPHIVHSDMERQNVLFLNNKVSGIVDIDAIREGDILFEFSHFLFNFVCCDPCASAETMDFYLEEAIKAGVITESDLVKIHFFICEFSVNDILSFLEVEEHRPIDISALINHYVSAVNFSKKYFRHALST